jgi:CYTH domain-containing protein
MDNKSFLTVKGVGDMVREEYEIPIYRQAFMSLIASMNGSMIVKNRYVIPPYDEHGCEHTIEIDVFHGKLAPLVLAEIEFKDEETAKKFVAPSWFGKEVTYDKAYKNSQLSLR